MNLRSDFDTDRSPSFGAAADATGRASPAAAALLRRMCQPSAEVAHRRSTGRPHHRRTDQLGSDPSRSADINFHLAGRGQLAHSGGMVAVVGVGDL
jgi:hypothetical protein